MLNSMKKSFYTFLMLLSLDRIMKHCALTYGTKAFGLLIWQPVMNQGLGFSLLSNYPPVLLTSLSLTALILSCWLPLPTKIKPFIFAGGLSNIFDRAYYGYVIDYLTFDLVFFQWPTVINLADLYLTYAFCAWLVDEYWPKTGIFHRSKLQSDQPY